MAGAALLTGRRGALLAAVIVVVAAALGGFLLGRGSGSPRLTGLAVITVVSGDGHTMTATGVVVSTAGDVLTAYHAVAAAHSMRVTLPATGLSSAAFVMGVAPAIDTALLGLQTPGHFGGPPAAADVPASGTQVTALVAGDGDGTAVAASVTARSQTVTALASLPGQLTELRDLFEFNAQLPAAAAGAPVLDASGSLVGIRSVGAADVRLSNAPADAQFAEPIGPLLRAARDIEANRPNPDVLQGSGAVLGLSVIDRAGAKGPTVTTVSDCSPAQAAGITSGDVVIAVAGTAVASSAAILNVLTRHHPGDRVRVDYIDPSGRPQHVDVQVVSGTLN